MAEPRGIPYSVGEARRMAETYTHLDIYVRQIILWLCDQIDADKIVADGTAPTEITDVEALMGDEEGAA